VLSALLVRKLLIRKKQFKVSQIAGLASAEGESLVPFTSTEVTKMNDILQKLWQEDEGQDIAEYAVMLAVILVIVVGTIRLIGGNANNVFSSVASSIQQ
jgi:Flp pilus assembly pilin Flp